MHPDSEIHVQYSPIEYYDLENVRTSVLVVSQRTMSNADNEKRIKHPEQTLILHNGGYSVKAHSTLAMKLTFIDVEN